MKDGLVFDIHRGTTHDGPGMRTTVFFKGCPLHCTWCQNPESICGHRELMWDAGKCIGCMECIKVCPVKALTPEENGIKIDRAACRNCFACAVGCPSKAMQAVGKLWEIPALVREACKDRMFFDDFSGGVTVSGGEPLLQSEFLLDFLEKLKKEGVNTALDTSGYGRQEVLNRVYPFVDTFLYDIKFIDEEKHQRHTGVSNKIILENLKFIADKIRRQKDSRLWIRTPLIPGATAVKENIEEIGEFIRKEVSDVMERWELCAFNYVCKDKYIKMGQSWKYAECTLLECGTVQSLSAIAEKYAEGSVVVSGLMGQKKRIVKNIRAKRRADMKKHYFQTWESLKEHQVPQWYEDCKIGVMICWGPYSVPAYAPTNLEFGEVAGDEEWFCNNSYAEWYFNSVNVGKGPTYEHHKATYGEDFPYENFVDMWKAEKWEPDEWGQLFENAGIKYVVLVTKHHDGFCLFPSKYTDYNSVMRGPKRDITGELSRAVRKHGIRMGTYYSGLLDWTFEDTPIYGDTQGCFYSPTSAYADYAYLQSKELIDTYKPSVFWNDVGWPKQGEHALPNLFAHYYNTVEDGVVDDRFNGLYHDFTTKEYQSGEGNRNVKWEFCRGMGMSFGYNAEEQEESMITVPELIHLLVETVSNNGNLLIDIGPKADGTIPAEQVSRLQAMGKWLEHNGKGIYGTRCSERENEQQNGTDVFYTVKEDSLYVFADLKGELPEKIYIRGGKTVTALDERVKFTYTQAAEGILVQVNENASGFGMVGFEVKTDR